VGEAAAKIARAVHAAPRPNEATRREIMARVKKLQDRAGYRGDYKAYMSEARPKRA
jgi:hypothetical protein